MAKGKEPAPLSDQAQENDEAPRGGEPAGGPPAGAGQSGGARTESGPAVSDSPLDFWFGVFLVFYSGGFLSIALRLQEYGTTVTRAGAFAWVALGLALFVAGGFAFNRGLGYRPSRVALAVAASLLGFRSLYGAFTYGNPFAGAATALARFSVGLGVIADLLLAAAGAWFVAAVARSEPDADRRFGQAGLLFLAALAFQGGVVPLLDHLLYLASDPGALRGLGSAAAVVFAVRLLPTVVKGVAGGVGLWAVWTGVKRRRPTGTSVWATGLWAVADILLIVALWVNWSGPVLAVTPPLALQIRTSLFIGLPALALLGLASALRRAARA